MKLVKPYQVALVGNPNAGKTTLFNGLTGSRQKVANYAGVTVEKISGHFKIGTIEIDCIDLPGLYSLVPVSEDEHVALNVLTGKAEGETAPDLVVYVLDASNLERNLYLLSQILELKLPVVVALTMVDRLEIEQSVLDVTALAKELGVPVVPIVGHKEKGLDQLREKIAEAVENPKPTSPISLHAITESSAAQVLIDSYAREGQNLTTEEAETLLTSENINEEISEDSNPQIYSALKESQSQIVHEPQDASPEAVKLRYDWAARIKQRYLVTSPQVKKSVSDRIDRVITHRVWGLLIFVLAMFIVFQSIYTFAQPFMDLIQGAFDSLSTMVRPHLASTPILQSFICDGVFEGVGAMLVFLPQICILFFFISVLEGIGYLSRAAFLMDRLFGWCGLSGRAFIPLLSSFACAIPGIMSARIMPDKKSRLATILIAPLMSCSARLPVYLLLIGAFIEPRFGPFVAGLTLFGMYILGLFVAIPVVFFINRKMLRGNRLPFVLELPPYQMPRWKDVYLSVVSRGKVFVKVAGTTIVVMSTIIWALSYFPRSAEADRGYAAEYAASTSAPDSVKQAQFVDERRLENSFLGRAGKFIAPVMAPAGFDWRLTTAILSAFPARETVVPAMGIIFTVGKDVENHTVDLRTALTEAKKPDGKPLLNSWTAIGFMVFFALCCQCNSTLATVKRETNSWKWPLFMFSYMTALAYIGATLINQVGHLFGN